MKNRACCCRPSGRLFCWLIAALVLVALDCHAQSSGPATTVISDVVYRGDGTPARGTVLISWPAFLTAERKAVAAGSMSLNIGSAGSLNLALIPNEGATPAHTYYRVLLKLD